jgi:hypothetical protein
MNTEPPATKPNLTIEEIRERDRIYHRKRYEEKKDVLRAEKLENYYRRKDANPDFHPGKVGRPRKVTISD